MNKKQQTVLEEARVEGQTHTSARARKKARKRYPKRTNFDGPSFWMTIIGIVIVGVIAFFAFRIFSGSTNTLSADPSGNLATATGTPGKKYDVTQPAQKASSPWNNQEFVSAVMTYTADKLHLTLDQLTAQVQGGKQITEVAVLQGISADQLHSIELEALQAGLDKLISTNQRTQNEADNDLVVWHNRDPQKMNDDFTFELGGRPLIPGRITPTPAGN